ncbi:uncharacterized protein LOC143909727 [Arctopsyche grandis]|uniref:uncharacterized protein LOC143909727 n=1 Tax=Arctopsyche grandis TaxID=121162 RepID=UPI00406D85E2
MQHETPKNVDLDVLDKKAELSKLKKKLMVKDEKLRAITAELRMREAQVDEYKQNKLKLNGRHSKNFSEQKKSKKSSEDKRSQSAPQNCAEYQQQNTPGKTLGGGYKMCPKSSK